MTRIRVLLLGLLMLLCGLPQAEAAYPCPTGPGVGERQVGMGPGGNGIAPMPMCESDGSQQRNASSSAPLQPTGYWEKTWGAIAVDGDRGSLGAVVGMTSKSKAEKAATAKCLSEGGVNCEVDLTYKNQCGVMILGQNDLDLVSAATLEKAPDGRVSYSWAYWDEANAKLGALNACNADLKQRSVAGACRYLDPLIGQYAAIA